MSIGSVRLLVGAVPAEITLDQRGNLNGDSMALMLLGLLGFVLMTGILLTLVVLRWLRAREAANGKSTSLGFQPAFSSPNFHSLSIDPPRIWLAIRADNPDTVQKSLRLHNPVRCSWDVLIHHGTERKLFIAPPTRGWVLVVGHGLPDPDDDVDESFRFVTRLSRRVGHVQLFNANRALSHHAWVRAYGGQIIRAYAWAGKTLWNQGPLTAEEIQLGLVCHDYGEGDDADAFPSDSVRANTEKVHLLAAQWSCDLSTIDIAARPLLGIAGELSRSEHY